MADLQQAALPEQLGVRVAALEHQAELVELQRALDDTASRVRQQEQQFRQHRATMREIERQLEETERRSIGVKQRATAVSKDLERVGTIVDSQERFLSCCSTWRSEAGVTVASTPRKELLGTDSRASPGPASNQQLWEAVRELEQRLEHEAERRAAGQGEVLSVLGQGVQQLRSEQARHATDMEDRFRQERRRFKQLNSETQAQHTEQEKRADALEARVDALMKALSLEQGTSRSLHLARAAGGRPGNTTAGARPGAALLHEEQQTSPHARQQHDAQRQRQQPEVPLLHRLEQLEARVAEVHHHAEGAGNGSSASTTPGGPVRGAAAPSLDTTWHSMPSTPVLAGSVRLLPMPPHSDGTVQGPPLERTAGTPRSQPPGSAAVQGYPCTAPSTSLHGPSVQHPGAQAVLAAGRPSACAGTAGGAALGHGTPWPSPVRPSTPSPVGTPTRTRRTVPTVEGLQVVADSRWGYAPQLPPAPPVHIV